MTSLALFILCHELSTCNQPNNDPTRQSIKVKSKLKFIVIIAGVLVEILMESEEANLGS